MKAYHSLFAFLLFLLVGCEEKPLPGPPVVPDPPDKPVPIRISTFIETRATDAAFEAGDAVGVYVVNRDGSALSDSGNHADNVSFTFDGSLWKGSREIYWKDASTHADFYCYYPWRASVPEVRKLPVAVPADQSTESGYRSCDILWGRTTDAAPTSEPVSVRMRHAMSNLLVFLEPGNGYDAASLRADLESVVVKGVLTQGTLDLSDGSVTASGEPSEIIPLAEDDHYRALILPQTVQDAELVRVEVGGYSFPLRTSIVFQPNRQHRCTLTVNKTSEGIHIGIDSWETDGNDYGGTVN